LFLQRIRFSILDARFSGQVWQNPAEKSRNQKQNPKPPICEKVLHKIALSANSKAWRNRIGKNGQLAGSPHENVVWGLPHQTAQSDVDDAEQIALVRRAITQLPVKQEGAIVMRYFEQKDYKVL